jgi:Tfp pilus assembly PilM family ATPase
MADKARMKAALRPIDLDKMRKKFRVRKAGACIAIDLDGSTLRAVQTAPRGDSFFVSRILAEPLALAPDADRNDPVLIGRAIATTLERAGIKPGPVVMGIPRPMVVLRTLSLPAVEDDRELASMVHFQIAKDLPFRFEEAVVDFTLRRRVPGSGEEPDKVEVLVAAVKRDVVDFYRRAATEAKFKLAGLGWVSYANARCLAACKVTEGTEGAALVSLRPDEATVDIIERDSLLFSRGVPIKFHSEPPPEPNEGEAEMPTTYVDAATIEVVRSLHSYGGMEPHINVARMVVTGATGQEAAVVEALQNRLNIPCSVLDPATALGLPADAREHATGSISAIGLALSAGDADGLPFDFLNPKRPPVQRNIRRIRTLACTAAAAAALIFFFGLRKHFIDERLKVQGQIQAELTKEEKNRPLYRRMRQQAASLQEWAREGHNWLDHYAYLSSILPPSEEIYITQLSVGGQGTIRFAVQARNGETLAKLDKQLRAAGYNVKPLAITPASDKHGYNFRSNVELNLTDGMKIDLAKVNAPARPSDDASLDPPQPGGGNP